MRSNRARDTKLNRDVALKVLPDVFASDSARLPRFQREAQRVDVLRGPQRDAVFVVSYEGINHCLERAPRLYIEKR